MTEKRALQITASYQQYLDFVGSYVWEDINNELMIWLEDARDQLESSDNVVHLYHMQGVCEAIRRFLDLPSVILHEFNRPRNLEVEDDGEDGL